MKIIFNYAMSAIYLLLGLFLIIWGWVRFDALQNKGLGILLIAYGTFRAYRVYSLAAAEKRKTMGDENVNSNASSE